MEDESARPRFRGAVVTISDKGSAGLREDRSGPLLVDLVTRLGGEVVFRRVVPDDVEAVRSAFREAAAAVGRGLVLSTGGTGFSPRDTTPEAVAPLFAAAYPGVMELLRRDGRSRTPTAALSRGVAGRIGEALAVTLPGSARAVAEGCDALEPVVREMLFRGSLVW